MADSSPARIIMNMEMKRKRQRRQESTSLMKNQRFKREKKKNTFVDQTYLGGYVALCCP